MEVQKNQNPITLSPNGYKIEDEPMDLTKSSLAHLSFESIVDRCIDFSFDSPGADTPRSGKKGTKASPVSSPWINSTPKRKSRAIVRRRISIDQDSGIDYSTASESSCIDMDFEEETEKSSSPEPVCTTPSRKRKYSVMMSPILRDGAEIVSKCLPIQSPPSSYTKMFPRVPKRKLEEEFETVVDKEEIPSRPWRSHGSGLSPLAMQLPDPFKKRYF